MKRIIQTAVLFGSVFFLNACEGGAPTEPFGGLLPQFASVTPDLVTETANLTCAQLYPGVEGIQEFKLEHGTLTNGVKTVVSGVSVTISNLTDDTFDWSSNFDVHGVFVKGGAGGSNLYTYAGTSFVRGDTDLGVPNPANNSISHISFCYLPKLSITKTAVTSFTREHHWSLEKTGDMAELLLMPGVQGSVNYTVTAVYNGYTDSNWAVNGIVTVTNPWPAAADISGISDVITPGDISVTLDCGETFPYSLASGATLSCTYSQALPNADARVNTATVAVTSGPAGGSATANITFGAPSTSIDACINVYDDKTDPASPVLLGQACANALTAGKKAFMYLSTYTFTARECGDSQLVNTAYFDPTTGARVTATHTVDVTVDCPQGCTLTQGYWKTHSSYGPAPMDLSGAWEAIGGPDTPFHTSGKSWYQLFWTPPAGGNAYIQLAHQYMAASLSIEAGANPSAVATVLKAAEGFFATHTPTTTLTRAKRNEVQGWASMLDDYNNGLIGPGHCSAGGSD
jgi:hypothetical protein